MIKSIFFRALTLLGLTFVLIGCGAADPGEGGTGTPGTPGAAGLSAADVKAMAEEMIKNSRGKIDSANGEQVAWKILSIIKAAQPSGSCSLFTHTYLGSSTAKATSPGVPTAVTAGDTFLAGYKTEGKIYGGDGEFTVTGGTEAGRTATTGVLTAGGKFVYEFKNYSIDGKYFLNGSFQMDNKTAAAAHAAAASAGSSFEVVAAAGTITNVLTLSEKIGDKDTPIGTLTLATGFKHVIKVPAAGAATVATDAPCGSLIGWDKDDASKVTVAPVKDSPSTFKGEVEMKITTKGTAYAGGIMGDSWGLQGKNLEMLAFLVGPKA